MIIFLQFVLKDLFLSVCVCVCACRVIYVSASVFRSQKQQIPRSCSELQMVVSHMDVQLGTKLGISAGSVHTFNW